MSLRQLELPLWETLKSAAAVPENANLQQLWHSLDASIAPLEVQAQLEVAGDAITQIAQIVQQRSLLTLEEIDSTMQNEGPVVAADFFDKFVRQSMHVDFTQFVDPPPPFPRRVPERSNRKFPSDGRSVVGVVDPAALLEVLEEMEAKSAQTPTPADPLSVAHSEVIFVWAGAILSWMQLECNGEGVSLIQLQQALGMPMVEVWLGLLLGGQEEYEWEQHGDFYDPQGIKLRNRL